MVSNPSTGIIDATRPTSNNGTVAVLTGTTISFTAPNTIADSANGLAVFRVGTRIQIESPLNGQENEVLTSSAGTLTLARGSIVNESAGPRVELRVV